MAAAHRSGSRRSTAWGALAVLLAGVPARAAPDEKVLAAANAEQPALIETLKGLVQIETGSANAEGLRRMATLLAGRLQALGFNIERRKASAGPGGDVVIGTRSGSGRQIPDQAVTGGDVRLRQPGADTKLLEALKSKVASSKAVPDAETTVSLDVGRPPFLAGPKGQALAEPARMLIETAKP